MRPLGRTTDAPPRPRSRRGRISRARLAPTIGASTAPFSPESQSFLDNVIAQFADVRAWNDRLNPQRTRLRIWGSEVRILPGAPATMGSVLDTWVTVYAGDMGNSFVRFCPLVMGLPSRSLATALWRRARSRLGYGHGWAQGWTSATLSVRRDWQRVRACRSRGRNSRDRNP